MALPASIGRLSHLEFLAVNSNRLTSLPESFAGLTALKTLIANANKLSEVPAWLPALPALSSLQLANNSIRTLQPEAVAAWRDSLPAVFLQALTEESGEASTAEPSVAAGAGAGGGSAATVSLEGNPLLEPFDKVKLASYAEPIIRTIQAKKARR